SRAEAWIETSSLLIALLLEGVASRAEAWIETRSGAGSDLLPKVPPLISRVRVCHGARPGGIAQAAWQHRRASARLSRCAAAHGCNRRASCTAPPWRG